MRINLIITTVLYVLVLGSCRTGDKVPIGSIESVNIDSLIIAEINRNNTPAIALALFDLDTIIAFYHGVKGIDSKLTISENDKYNIGSCTKAITSLLAARVIKKGKIDYTTTVAEVFHEFKDDIHSYYWDKTIYDLLSHKAGIHAFVEKPEYDQIPSYVKKAMLDDRRLQFVKYVLQLPPTENDKNEFCYSNAGYTLAAVMLERVEGKSWEEMIQNEVFYPLGLQTWFGWPHSYSKNQTKGHLNPFEYDKTKANKLIQFPDSSDFEVKFVEPAGNLTLAIKEHGVVLQEILRGIDGKGILLSKNEYEKLLFSNDSYVNGWYQVVVQGRHYWGHEGSNGPFYARAILCGDKKYGLVILTNAGDKKTISGIQRITDYIDNKFNE